MVNSSGMKRKRRSTKRSKKMKFWNFLGKKR